VKVTRNGLNRKTNVRSRLGANATSQTNSLTCKNASVNNIIKIN
jgi:hypothetical protein